MLKLFLFLYLQLLSILFILNGNLVILVEFYLLFDYFHQPKNSLFLKGHTHYLDTDWHSFRRHSIYSYILCYHIVVFALICLLLWTNCCYRHSPYSISQNIPDKSISSSERHISRSAVQIGRACKSRTNNKI